MKKKLSALLIVVCLLCLCLTACGGVPTTKKLSLDNYAISLSQAKEQGLIAGSGDELETATELGTNTTFIPSSMASAKAVIYQESSGNKYSLYNIENGYTVLSGYDSMYKMTDYAVRCNSAGNTSVCALDGSVLLASDNWTVSNSTGTGTVAGHEVVLTITASKDGALTTVQCYLDEKGYARAIPQYEIDAATNTTEVLLSEGAVTARNEVRFDKFKGFTYKQYTENDSFMSSYYLAYTENNSGTTYYFDRRGNGTLTTLTVPHNTAGVMYADGKVIYTTKTLLPYTAEKGYNFVTTDQSDFTETQKYEYKAYSFDIEKGKTKELNLGYVILSATPQFNHNTGRYDAFAVSAVRIKNGVATYATEADVETFIVDKDGKVGIDLTTYKISLDTPIIKLDGDRNLALSSAGTGFILNGKGEIVANIGTGTGFSETDKINVSESNRLIVLSQNSRYAAVDFDGKMVLDYKYRSLDFYGNKACTFVDGIAGYRIVTSDNANGKGIKSALSLGNENLATNGITNGMVITQSTTGSGYEIKARNYSGNVLASFTASSYTNNISAVQLNGGAVYLTVSAGSTTKNYIVK